MSHCNGKLQPFEGLGVQLKGWSAKDPGTCLFHCKDVVKKACSRGLRMHETPQVDALQEHPLSLHGSNASWLVSV